MPVLVDYRCSRCRCRIESWETIPIAAELPCGRCGGRSVRIFGFGALITASGSSTAPAAAHLHDEVPGTCALTGTAARMLTARARSDNRALDREIAYQESAIADGRLDPSSSPLSAFPGGPAATGAAGGCGPNLPA